MSENSNSEFSMNKEASVLGMIAGFGYINYAGVDMSIVLEGIMMYLLVALTIVLLAGFVNEHLID